jgi:hypothetical protein
MNFNMNVSSLLEIEKVELNPENKQLTIRYLGGEWQHFDDFEVYVDIPKKMMSGPFTAVFNGMKLEVTEEQKDDRTTTLFLNETHLDVMQMNQSGSMEGMEMEESDQQNAIVITATSVIPEFPLAIPVEGTAIVAALIVA